MSHGAKIAVLATAVVVFAVSLAAADSSSEAVREQLRNRIEAAGLPAHLAVGGERIYAVVALPQFYERRAYRPAWTLGNTPTAQAFELMEAIRLADREGLVASDYHLAALDQRLVPKPGEGQAPDEREVRALVDMELLLSDAFLIYGSHLLAGRVNPETFDPEWFANRRTLDMAAVLQVALDAGAVGKSLHDLAPHQPAYAQLREALARYRAIAAAGGWPEIAGGAKIEPGGSDPRVTLLRRRLELEGYLREATRPAAPDRLNPPLEEALRAFQRHHGIDSDGVVGPATLKALNVSAGERMHQIILNMERWRWLPEDLGRRHILVNIADFRLSVVEDGRSRLEMKIIVGKSYRRSPVFSGLITYLVFNPYWQVPHKIAVADKLPLIRENPAYLAEQGFKLFEGWGEGAREVDPAMVDWSRVTAKNFGFRLRQDPGPKNALGRIKFMFPNRFSVYLHDTPSRTLFSKVSRSLSSGCIRIEKPLELAEYLLSPDRRWTPEAIAAILDNGKERTVQLSQPMPVHLLYWTAFCDGSETVDFRDDIYNRDARLASALESPPDS